MAYKLLTYISSSRKAVENFFKSKEVEICQDQQYSQE